MTVTGKVRKIEMREKTIAALHPDGSRSRGHPV